MRLTYGIGFLHLREETSSVKLSGRVASVAQARHVGKHFVLFVDRSRLFASSETWRHCNAFCAALRFVLYQCCLRFRVKTLKWELLATGTLQRRCRWTYLPSQGIMRGPWFSSGGEDSVAALRLSRHRTLFKEQDVKSLSID